MKLLKFGRTLKDFQITSTTDETAISPWMYAWNIRTLLTCARLTDTPCYRRYILSPHNPENCTTERREWLNTDYSQCGLMYKLGVVADPFWWLHACLSTGSLGSDRSSIPVRDTWCAQWLSWIALRILTVVYIVLCSSTARCFIATAHCCDVLTSLQHEPICSI